MVASIRLRSPLFIPGFISLYLAATPAFSQARFQGIGFLSGAVNQISDATAVSPDGTVVVGSGHSANGVEAIRWTQSGGIVGLGDLPGGMVQSSALGVSLNGNVIVGFGDDDRGGESIPFRWTQATDMVELPPLGGGGANAGQAFGVSADGNVTVGWGVVGAARWTGLTANPLIGIPDTLTSRAYATTQDGSVVVGISNAEAFRWTAGGVAGLGHLSGTVTSEAYALSGDGAVVVGRSGGEAFRWTASSGMVGLGDLPGAGFSSLARAVSGDGSVIVGFGTSAVGTEAMIWTADGGMLPLKSVLENQYGLDLTGWRLLEARGISSDGLVIVGGGFNPNNKREGWRAELSPIRITRPRAGQLFLSGTRDTIRWSAAATISSVTISLSTDGGGVFNSIVQDLPADSGKYVWSIPDSILSRKSKIEIADATQPNTYVDSDIFRIKGYELTRTTAGGDYERFQRGVHDWSFGNTRDNMWPPGWWSRFSYPVTIDPYTHNPYPMSFYLPFWFAFPSDFPDWPLFVRTFGSGQCYFNEALGFYSLSATFRWRAIKRNWGGSCSGMAISSLLAFDRKTSFASAFPEMPPFILLNLAPLTDSSRMVPNQLWVHWFGRAHQAFFAQKYTTTPDQTINELKALFASDNPDNRYLYLANHGSGGGAHAVVPYKVEHDTVNKQFYWIHLYDNSYNTTSNTRIRVDTTGNSGSGSWISTTWAGWGGNDYLLLMDSSSSYVTQPLFKSSLSTSGPIPLAGGPSVEVYPPQSQRFSITDAVGNTIGFVDSLVVNTIPGAVPLIPPIGAETPPYTYLVPPSQYAVHSEAPLDSVVLVSVFSDSLTYCYLRTDAAPSHSDDISIGAGMGVRNGDADPRTITLQMLIKEPTQEKLFHISGFSLTQGDSAHFSQTGHDRLRLTNTAAPKKYNMEIIRASSTTYPRFVQEGMTLPSNSSHEIVPDWSDFGQPVTILVDLGNNGTIDDTLFVDNALDVPDRGALDIPDEFLLAQNYPNPFNASTRIEYALPYRSHVRLTVYNVLGQIVSTLVDEERPAGRFAVEWNGSNVSSGLYFCRLEARQGNGQVLVAGVKKMILMK